MEVINITPDGDEYEKYILNCNPNLKKELEKYRQRNNSELTIKSIKKAIINIFKIVGKDRIEELTIEDIERFIKHRREKKRILKEKA